MVTVAPALNQGVLVTISSIVKYYKILTYHAGFVQLPLKKIFFREALNEVNVYIFFTVTYTIFLVQGFC
jgi:hypothetical protein